MQLTCQCLWLDHVKFYNTILCLGWKLKLIIMKQVQTRLRDVGVRIANPGY